VLTRVSLSRFRNIDSCDLEFDSKNIAFVGTNGQGKTNLLESVYFLSYLSSFRTRQNDILIKNGNESAEISGVYINPETGYRDKLRTVIKKKEKLVFLDDKEYAGDRKEFIRRNPCVVFCHEDYEFAMSSQERRRWFFDQTLTLCDIAYLDDLRNYRKIVQSRNMALKTRDSRLLDALDIQLCQFGQSLMKKREYMIKAFSNLFTDFFHYVSDITKKIIIKYRPSWEQANTEGILSTLEKKREMEFERGFTSTGPHKDQFYFVIENKDFSLSASMGQIRLISLSLRSCQANYYSLMTGRKPILLLDDVLLELDSEKRKKILEILPEYEQAFFTFLDTESKALYEKEDFTVFSVNAGTYSIR
jgi:DNA replication and repair protein RecF